MLATHFCVGNVGTAHAGVRCVSHTDAGGVTTIRCLDGTRGHLVTDPAGVTTGWLGNEAVGIREMPSGRALGRIGDRPFELYTDRFGVTRGRFVGLPEGLSPALSGLSPVPSPRNLPRSFLCRTDGAGTKRCR